MEPISIGCTPICQYKPWYIRKLIICDFGDLPWCIINPRGTVQLLRATRGENILVRPLLWPGEGRVRQPDALSDTFLPPCGQGLCWLLRASWGDHLYSSANIAHLALTSSTKSARCAAELAPKWSRSGKCWKFTTSQFSCLHEGHFLSRSWQMNKRKKLFRRPFPRVPFWGGDGK